MKKYCLLIFAILSFIDAKADGVVVPSNDKYPYTFLKNKSISVQVNIYGLLAETIVEQAFKNEWQDTISGVYSFPLPPDARVTRLQYSIKDTILDAILKVQQQSTTPGTGEGGKIAELNQYMGMNVIKLTLNRIEPGEIRSIRLTYTSVLKQYNGTYEYTYPHNTSLFIKYPLDYAQFKFNIHSSKSINSFHIPSHTDYEILNDEPNRVELLYYKPKVYAAEDLVLQYTIDNEPFDLDLYTWNPDSSDGYFTLVGKPQKESADSTFSKELYFILCNSTTMIGNKLNQSKKAINLALDELNQDDFFNIMVFNSNIDKWQETTVSATKSNIDDAKDYLNSVSTQSGNRLDVALQSALNDLKDTDKPTAIIAFTDGRSPIDPYLIEDNNTQLTSIFFVGIGNQIDRVRLEEVANLNYGSVFYFDPQHLLAEDISRILTKIKSPILKGADYNFDNPVTYDVLPKKNPTIFAGTDFIIAGRYQNPGSAEINLNGNSYHGDVRLSFQKDFIGNNEIGRKIWAKMAIDQLEAYILINGESDSLKNALIDLSLGHNIRCRYTAYTQNEAVERIIWSDIGEGGDYILSVPEEPVLNKSFYNYPNPFKYSTTLHFIVKKDVTVQKIVLYNILGEVLKIIDVSDFEPGTHEITLYADEFKNIPKGIILAYQTDGYKISGRTILICTQ